MDFKYFFGLFDDDVVLEKRRHFNELQRIQAKGMFVRYKEYCKEHGFEKITSIKKFYSELDELGLPMRRTEVHNLAHYDFVPRDVYVKMRANDWFQTDDKYDAWVKDDIAKLNATLETEFPKNYIIEGVKKK